jgi:microcompartment protein CcmK/EutM
VFLAKVIGTVWSSVKWQELGGVRLLLVRPYSLEDLGARVEQPSPRHDGVVCADVLGAGPGEDVVIAYGHAARVAVSGALPDGARPAIPIDAAVVAIVDRHAVDPESLRTV